MIVRNSQMHDESEFLLGPLTANCRMSVNQESYTVAAELALKPGTAFACY